MSVYKALRVKGKDFNMRWVASMVRGEVHRILVRGGIYVSQLKRVRKTHKDTDNGVFYP
jgi:fructose-1,6-bisphosphatase